MGYAVSTSNKLLLSCLSPLSRIFQLYGGGQLYWIEETGVSIENSRHSRK
jgi:hypothetical protein